MQKVSPDQYASLELPDQWIEDQMQDYEARWIIDQLDGYKTVLELGYGAGIITRAMIKAGKDVTMVDGSQDLCNRATEDGAFAICSLFEDVNFVGKFDCVIASFVLEHVIDPVSLLMKCGQWGKKLIVVIGNANSYHRQLAVKMGLQETIYDLSARDHKVGHYKVYDFDSLKVDLGKAGLLKAGYFNLVPYGFQFKPLPNGMMKDFDPALIHAMCQIKIDPLLAANIGVVIE